jgi:hypothetical protein
MPSKNTPIIYALMAVLAPTLSVLVFYVLYVRVLGRLATNRNVAAVMMVLLVAGAYCGVVALRSGGAHIAVRVIGLAGAAVSVVWAVPLLVATVFGI